MALKYGGNNENVSVAIANYDMSGAKLITDNRIGESGANVRSNKYSQIATTDSGDVYVFSGTGGLITSEKREVRGRDGKVRTQTVYTSDGSKAGVVRIKKGVETFDTGYHFNIYEKSGGYQFQKVFYIGGDKFLVEFFAEKGKFTMNDEAGKFALVDVNAKTINWLTNLPTLHDSQFPVGYGSSYNKVLYLPITKSDGSCSVYTINEKGEVKEHIKLKAGQTSRAVSIIVE